jgi:hypothetical protein
LHVVHARRRDNAGSALRIMLGCTGVAPVSSWTLMSHVEPWNRSSPYPGRISPPPLEGISTCARSTWTPHRQATTNKRARARAQTQTCIQPSERERETDTTLNHRNAGKKTCCRGGTTPKENPSIPNRPRRANRNAVTKQQTIPALANAVREREGTAAGGPSTFKVSGRGSVRRSR